MAEKLTLEQVNAALEEIAGKVGVINDRLRLLEERSHQNREKIRVVDENLIIKFKDLSSDIKRLSLEVDEMRSQSNKLGSTIKRLVKDFGDTARLSDVKVLEKVFDFFDPTMFLTRDDVMELINERLK